MCSPTSPHACPLNHCCQGNLSSYFGNHTGISHTWNFLINQNFFHDFYTFVVTSFCDHDASELKHSYFFYYLCIIHLSFVKNQPETKVIFNLPCNSTSSSHSKITPYGSSHLFPPLFVILQFFSVLA